MFVDYDETADYLLYTAHYIDGGSKYHCISGPARVWEKGHPAHPNGCEEWWFDGELIPVSSQQEFERWLKMKAFW